jgi:hypothetical protein
MANHAQCLVQKELLDREKHAWSVYWTKQKEGATGKTALDHLLEEAAGASADIEIHLEQCPACKSKKQTSGPTSASGPGKL